MPPQQQSTLCCLTLLAMANIKKEGKFEDATNEWIRIHDVIDFVDKEYGIIYAENSRETFRKQAMHHFRNAAIIEDNGKATNSPNYRYRITNEFLRVIRSLQEFLSVPASDPEGQIRFKEADGEDACQNQQPGFHLLTW